MIEPGKNVVRLDDETRNFISNFIKESLRGFKYEIWDATAYNATTFLFKIKILFARPIDNSDELYGVGFWFTSTEVTFTFGDLSWIVDLNDPNCFHEVRKLFISELIKDYVIRDDHLQSPDISQLSRNTSNMPRR